ncbi:hypothetical protein ACLB1Q_05890 [Escherichia coli]
MSTGLRSRWKWTACHRMLLRWFPLPYSPSHSLHFFPSTFLWSVSSFFPEFAQVLDKMAYLTVLAGR